MERLWTPWRKAFVESSADEAGDGGATAECFLDAAAADGDDAQRFVVYRGERVFVLLNLYPYNNGHLLVAPYAHTGDLAALEPATAAELMRVTQRGVAVLEQAYHPHGFNLGINLGRTAGAGLPDHLHVHVVPRWNGDTNFMPVVGETKVLPESLDQTYARLRPLFAAPDARP